MFSLSIFLAEVEEATRPLGAEDNYIDKKQTNQNQADLYI